MRIYESKGNVGGAADVFNNTSLNGTEAYSIMQELSNAVLSSGITAGGGAGDEISDETGANPAETFQLLAKAMSIIGGGGSQTAAVTTETSSLYTLDPIGDTVGATEYFDGMQITFTPGVSSVGTPYVNYNGIGNLPVMRSSSIGLLDGQIQSNFEVTLLCKKTVNPRFEIITARHLLQESVSGQSSITLPKGVDGISYTIKMGSASPVPSYPSGLVIPFETSFTSTILYGLATDWNSSIATQPTTVAVSGLLTSSITLVGDGVASGAMWLAFGW